MLLDKEKKYWDKIAQKYAKQPVANKEAYQHKLKKTQEYLQPNMEVLEIGCGTASTAITHSKYVSHIHATDISSNMLAIAKDKVQAKGIGNISFENTTIETITLAPNSYDVVMAHSVLHLLENKEEAIAKIYTSLKPSGIFISSTACIKDMFFVLAYIIPIGRFLGFFPLVKYFTGEMLKDSVRESGFNIEYEWRPSSSQSLFLIARNPLNRSFDIGLCGLDMLCLLRQ